MQTAFFQNHGFGSCKLNESYVEMHFRWIVANPRPASKFFLRKLLAKGLDLKREQAQPMRFAMPGLTC